MKRFKVQTADGHTLLLYYPTQEKAQENYPDIRILEYVVLCMGGKLPKPEEIRAVRKFASVPFEGICRCQLFLKGDDLYIKHNDYFSETHYPGTIDPHIRHAWLRITNFVPLVKLLNSVEVADTVWTMIRGFHHWPAGEYNMEWARFLESVAETTRHYLNKV